MPGQAPGTDRLDEALSSIDTMLERGFETGVAAAAPDPLRRPDGTPSDSAAELAERARTLGPWAQGPFNVTDDLVLGDDRRDDRRWAALAAELPPDLTGQSVLDIGCRSGYDSVAFAQRGPAKVVACEWSSAIDQARFVNEVYATGAELLDLDWRALDPDGHGRFDVVHANGVLQREPHPMNLLAHLWRLTEPGGTLLIGSRMFDMPALSEYAELIRSPDDGAAEGWIAGRLALRWMVEVSGFDVERWFGERPASLSGRPVVDGYLRAVRADRQPALS